RPEDEQEQRLATREPQACECVAADRGEHEVRESDCAGDDRAVQRVAPEVERVEGLVVAGGRPVPRQERKARNRVGQRPERRRHTPEERDREQDCNSEQHDVGDRGADAVPAFAARNAGGDGLPARSLARRCNLLGDERRRNRTGAAGRRKAPAALHQATSALPKRNRWITVTVKMKTKRTTPMAAA